MTDKMINITIDGEPLQVPAGTTVLKAAEKVVGHEIPTVLAGRRAGDPATLVASSEKARSVLGWKPEFADIETILETAWQWHSGHPNGYGK